MTIVRCTKCRIVVLDSNDDGEREVQCAECGNRYKINLDEGEVVSLVQLKSKQESKEV